ncbi:hypothetical protein PBT90_16760 [Algoriphagus halophytocola]|uniref:DUF6712 family protein n=1 Tax=Algoriphagus halophytocola TaxID=2991499 RepID=UPI0022DD4CE0|nr:DUF6712 family protein [Algoriphagus sp. TR-M9]WBL42389.1 hypothetical protein PBT90_16760 [Algoriphagus sp. TR-M9]
MIQFKTDQIKERISSTTTFNPQLHMAHINRAYRNHIERFFPEEQYEELDAELATPLDPGATDPEKAERAKKEKLYSLFYDALANLGYYYTIPHLEVTVTSTGIVSTKTNDREKADARQIIRLEKSFAEAGLENLDRLIKYLIKEVALFTWWTAVFAASGYQNLIVSDHIAFQRWVDISESALVFLQLRPVINHIERLEVAPVLGNTLYQAILPILPASDPNYQLRENVSAFIACRSMADGLKMKNVGMNEKGLYQIYIENQDYGKHPPLPAAVQEKINLLNALASQYRDVVTDFITPPEEGDSGILGYNEEDSGFFHTWG